MLNVGLEGTPVIFNVHSGQLFRCTAF